MRTYKGVPERTERGGFKVYRRSVAGYILEHILVWERTNGKCLPDGWTIHHLNGVKDDNRPENLMALPNRQHQLILKAVRQRVRELELKLKTLKEKLKQENLL